MLKENAFVYLFFYVKDLAKTREFYERTLGFSVLEEDPDAVKYDAGEVILALNRGRDFGIDVAGAPETTSLFVFHVDDIDAMRASLEAKGVTFDGPTDRYDIGATASFYDPDGHSITLYELSDEAKTWPSAAKIERVLRGNSRDHTILRLLEEHGRNSSTTKVSPEAFRSALGSRKLVYIFRFVSDAEKTRDFYERILRLPVVERDGGAGVVKYDAGGFLLATHSIEREPGAEIAPGPLVPHATTALVLYASDLESAHARLAAEGVVFDLAPRRSRIGKIAQFRDPDGHVFYLYEPSPEAMSWPSGAKIEQLIAAEAADPATDGV